MLKRFILGECERKMFFCLFCLMFLSGCKQINKDQFVGDDKRNLVIFILDNEKVIVFRDYNVQFLDEKNKVVNECDKMNKDLVDVYEKLKEVEREIENLKELLSMKIKKEFDNCEVDVSDKII